MNKLFTIKKDKYREARQNYTRMMEIHCRKCNNTIVIYQKDGPGTLRRIYMDRIFYPKSLVNLQKKKLSKIKLLRCQKCKGMIAMPYIYKKEKRKAFRLFQDTIKKKVIPSKR